MKIIQLIIQSIFFSTNHPVNVFALLKGLVEGLGVGDNPKVKVFCSLKMWLLQSNPLILCQNIHETGYLYPMQNACEIVCEPG